MNLLITLIVHLNSFMNRGMSMSFGVNESIEFSCPHCGFNTKVNNRFNLQLFYCKRCQKVQNQPTKNVVETIIEKEHRGFWQWLFNMPSTIRRKVHADIIAYQPACHFCKHSDMMVPFDQEHCPVCGNLLERHDNLFNCQV